MAWIVFLSSCRATRMQKNTLLSLTACKSQFSVPLQTRQAFSGAESMAHLIGLFVSRLSACRSKVSRQSIALALQNLQSCDRTSNMKIRRWTDVMTRCPRRLSGCQRQTASLAAEHPEPVQPAPVEAVEAVEALAHNAASDRYAPLCLICRSISEPSHRGCTTACSMSQRSPWLVIWTSACELLRFWRRMDNMPLESTGHLI